MQHEIQNMVAPRIQAADRIIDRKAKTGQRPAGNARIGRRGQCTGKRPEMTDINVV